MHRDTPPAAARRCQASSTAGVVLAKAVGWAVVGGSFFRSVPQIIRICKSKSELAVCTVHMGYNLARGYPFSSYGDTATCGLQCAVIIALMFRHGDVSKPTKVLVTLGILAFTVWILFNFCGDTILSLAGNVGRLFTTLMLVDDVLVLAGAVIQLILNGILLAQTTAKRRWSSGAVPPERRPLDQAEEALPFQVYSPTLNAAYWSRHTLTVARRSFKLCGSLLLWYLGGLLPWASRLDRRELLHRRAARLREVLVDLGAASVKIGQAISSRPDVAPPEFTVELEKLQDQIPPFPTAQAMAILEEELGRPAAELFSELTPEPVAAACTARACGPGVAGLLAGPGAPSIDPDAALGEGAEVAIKVQRPGVAAQISLDVFILRGAAGALQRLLRLQADAPALLDEWASSLYKELDYRGEARNAARFRALYGGMREIHVPRVHAGLTTRRVLVMEWVRGRRLRTAGSREGGGGGGAASRDDLRLVDVGVRCSLEQMLGRGFYHADPHPGNLLKTEDGRLCYIDFGMMGEIDGGVRRALLRATLHLVNREYRALADDFAALGMLPARRGAAEDVSAALTRVFAGALAGGVSELSFARLSSELSRVMYAHGFRIPTYYTLLVRSLSVLEGIALASDPDYKVLSAAYPWIARRLLLGEGPDMRATLLDLLYKDRQFQFFRMAALLDQAARGGAGDFNAAQEEEEGGNSGERLHPDSSSPPTDPESRHLADVMRLVLGRGGVFLRAVLVDELAAAAEASTRLALDDGLAAAKRELRAFVLGADAARDLPPYALVLAQATLNVASRVPEPGGQPRSRAGRGRARAGGRAAARRGARGRRRARAPRAAERDGNRLLLLLLPPPPPPHHHHHQQQPMPSRSRTASRPCWTSAAGWRSRAPRWTRRSRPSPRSSPCSSPWGGSRASPPARARCSCRRRRGLRTRRSRSTRPAMTRWRHTPPCRPSPREFAAAAAARAATVRARPPRRQGTLVALEGGLVAVSPLSPGRPRQSLAGAGTTVLVRLAPFSWSGGRHR
ncbi:hypothetical protein QBZ16_000660 [Prototheca wickerhamii]|uniref:ABC1 atypical kinase-like domain-containing protein n=1 Tax=Prototheca wickerhamii TaxID=3111 RepID=A0AAD9MPB1_PROWI|nr:hypothetical protein QBZ16_000660 [Prototheca wickerhamii]